ncbi:MAG: hypothetical protein ACREQN_17990 [Candidatus Binataceae bacterium]
MLVALAAATLGMPLMLGGCSRRFKQTVRNNPECVTQAGINQNKIDNCLSGTRRRDEFNTCLASRGVGQMKIDRLNQCIDAHRYSY